MSRNIARNYALVKAVAFLTVALITLVILGRGAVAVSSVFPDHEQPDSVAVVAKAGDGYALDAPIARFKVFSPNPDFDIIIKDICSGLRTENWATIVRVYRNNESENPYSHHSNFGTSRCGGSNARFSVTDAARSTVAGHGGYYSATVIVQRMGVGGGLNGFKVKGPSDGFVTYVELPIELATNNTEPTENAFALVSEDFNHDSLRSYTLRFRTPCELNPGVTTAYLKWKDADFGRDNQDGDISFTLTNTTTREKVLSISGAELGGQGEYKYASFPIAPDSKFKWEWSKVNGDNGIQIWMPFSTVAYEFECPTDQRWEYHVAVSAPREQDVESTFNVSSRISNNTSVDGALPPGGRNAHRIEIVSGAHLVTRTSQGNGNAGNGRDALWWGFPIIAARSSLNHTGSWRATSPGTVCFNSRVYPSEGPPGRSSPDRARNAPARSCVTISAVQQRATCADVTVQFDEAGDCSGTWTWSVPGSVSSGGNTYSLFQVRTVGRNAYESSFHAQTFSGSTTSGMHTFPYDDINGRVVTRTYAWYQRFWSDWEWVREREFNSTTGRWEWVEEYQWVHKSATTFRDFGAVNRTFAACNWRMTNDSRISGTQRPKPGDGVTPGDSVSVNMRATNRGIQPSGNQLICAYVVSGYEYLASSSMQYIISRVGADKTQSKTASWQLRDSTEVEMPHNALIHIRVQMTPISGDRRGYTYPVRSLYQDFYYRIFNKRFDFFDGTHNNNKNIINALARNAYFPGQEVAINAEFPNRDTAGRLDFRGSVAGHAPAGALTATLSILEGADRVTIERGSMRNPRVNWADSFRTGSELEIKVNDTAIVGERVCVRVTLTPNKGFSDGDDPRGINSRLVAIATDCFYIKDGPYISVLDGDIWAGANFDPGTNVNVEPVCIDPSDSSLNADSIIRGLRSANLATLWRGSFVEYAAFATGDITNFATGIVGDPRGQPATATSLTFANHPDLGSFTNAPRCIPNYFGLLHGVDPAGTELLNPTFTLGGANSRESGQYYHSGNLTIRATGSDLQADRDVTLVVDGDVSIVADGGNTTIAFVADYTRNARGELNVPSLIIVASGNIYIDAGITQVDAVLISHGEVWTCADDFRGVKTVDTATCVHQLTINGAIIANRINFMRTHGIAGGVHNPVSQPAEIINFTPEFYLSNPIFKSNVADIQQLRVMLFKDLPPIY